MQQWHVNQQINRSVLLCGDHANTVEEFVAVNVMINYYIWLLSGRNNMSLAGFLCGYIPGNFNVVLNNYAI